MSPLLLGLVPLVGVFFGACSLTMCGNDVWGCVSLDGLSFPGLRSTIAGPGASTRFGEPVTTVEQEQPDS